jgi:molybdopterin molybdotransferase
VQEDTVADGARVRITEAPRRGYSVRRQGLDFARGDTVIAKGTRLGPRSLGLAAAVNAAALAVYRRPRVALFTTGDELVAPGGRPHAHQIISSNSIALAHLIRRAGAEVTDLGIVPDTLKATRRAVAKALAYDILITTGGASVGEHDYVRPAFLEEGIRLDFWRVAMRPGKPLMFGRRKGQRVMGLPGNPVSALVCAEIFLKPLIARLTGLAPASGGIAAIAGAALKANDKRQDFLRARLTRAPDGRLIATPFPLQDSSLQRTLAEAQCLILRPPFAPAAAEGAEIEILPLDD